MAKLLNLSSTGFFDLNIPAKSSATTTLRDVALQAIKLGYTSLAVNTILNEEYLMPAKKKAKKDDGQPAAVSKDIPPPPKLNFIAEELKKDSNCKKEIAIYQRLTVSFSDPAYCHKLIQSENVKKYDILAVTPTTAAAFQYAVANLDVDIICLDPEVAGSFKINRRQYLQGVGRGLFYEISYSSLLTDASLRKKVIQMSHMFHAVGKSRNIMITSGATSQLDLRGPYDVINLSLLLGLSEGESYCAVTRHCRSVLLRAASRVTGKCVSFAERVNENDWRTKETKNSEKLLEESVQTEG